MAGVARVSGGHGFCRTNELAFVAFTGEVLLRTGPAGGPARWLLLNPPQRTTGLAWRQDRSGVLWYYTREGALGQLAGTNFVVFGQLPELEGRTVKWLGTDSEGHIWVGTDRALAVWAHDRFVDHTPTNGESPLAVDYFFCTRDGGAWVLSNGRLRKCIGRAWVTEAHCWGSNWAEYIAAVRAYEDRRGGVWFCHYGQGIFHVRPDGVLRHITSADGLPGNRVSCWLEDREGNFWVGIDRGGLVRFRERQFRVIGAAQGLAGYAVMTVCEDTDGTMWVGTAGAGLLAIGREGLFRFEPPAGAAKGFIFSAFPGNTGQLWVSAGREDLAIFRNGQFVAPHVNVHGVKAIFVDRSGRLWLGKNNGLACVSDGALREFGPGEGLSRSAIRAIAQDKDGCVWVGGDDGTLYELEGMGPGRFIQHRPADALPGEAIWALLADGEDRVWLGTFRGGLLRFERGGFTRYTTADGLASDVICQILDDGAGNLWLGSDRGIFRVPKAALEKFKPGTGATIPCAVFGVDDGLPTVECTGGYQPSCWRSRDGTLWFATMKGAVSVRPDDVLFNSVPPTVVLEEVFVDGQPVGNARFGAGAAQGNKAGPGGLDHALAERNALSIRSGKHRIEFHYTAPSFVSPHRVRFRYKLDGFDQHWVEAGNRRVAEYSNLQPGQYTFRVVACNNSGLWNEAGASVLLKVLPRFWETWWFRILTGLVFAGGFASAARIAALRRVKRRVAILERDRAVARERARIAADMHDELGSGLTQIMLESALAQRASAGEVPVHLAKIAERARDLIRQMDEIVWAINPQNDTLESLATYLSKYAQEYLSGAGIRCRFDFPDALPSQTLSAEVRHNLFLAVKEALHNVVKHASASEVKLKMALQPHQMTIVIADNGRGFDTTSPGSDGAQGRICSGQGIRNMQKRLESIGGACVIGSQPGQGATVEMIVPIGARAGAQKVD